MFLLYNLLLTILAPIWVPAMLLKSRKRKESPNWKERQGNYRESLPPRKESGPRLWIHAVSVGEFVAGQPLLRALRKSFPNHELVVSITTSSGHQTARSAKEADPTLYDYLVYFPLDIPRATLNAMQRVQPDAVIILETELWMNFLWAAKSFSAKTFLVNGRISDKSFPRKLKAQFFYESLLKEMDLCLMQTEQDADRVRALGARDVQVTGNIKFDQAIEGLNADPQTPRQALGFDTESPIIVVGSTRSELEENLVLDALQRIGWDRIQVLHAPRHLERVPALQSAAAERGANPVLRSSGEPGRFRILDTYGELAGVYAIADVVIIGGGFDRLGGQNLLQPLAHGKAVLHGPHMQNFRDVAALASQAGASQTVATADELADALRALLENPAKRAEMGSAAQNLVRQNVGATERIVSILQERMLA